MYFVRFVLVAIGLIVGMVLGFRDARLKYKPKPVTIIYCTPSDPDARCVEARKHQPSAAASSDGASTPSNVAPEPR